MSGLRVRPVRSADLPLLRELSAETLAHRAPALLDAAPDPGPPVGVVAVDAATPVGYALVCPGAGAVYLAELAVAPARQGEGVGTRLVEAVLDRLRSRSPPPDRLRVTTPTEGGAREFYERRGFEPVKRLPGFYDTAPRDAVALARPL